MNPPKMPIHIGDYKRDTGHLRAAGHGAYLLLLFHHWSTGSLPDDDEQLAAIACMTNAEWRKIKPVIAKFFNPGWTHGRVEKDLESAKQSYEKRAKAGEKGGKAKAEAKQSSSNATAGPKQPLTLDQTKKDTSSLRSDAADAADDPRTRLFREGLGKLAAMTGKGPDACRSFIGKCLKSSEDSAVGVLGLIEDAERNRVADPASWIAARLKTRENSSNGRRTVQQAADDLIEKLRSFDEPAPAGLRDGTGEDAIRLLPPVGRG